MGLLLKIGQFVKKHPISSIVPTLSLVTMLASCRPQDTRIERLEPGIYQTAHGETFKKTGFYCSATFDNHTLESGEKGKLVLWDSFCDKKVDEVFLKIDEDCRDLSHSVMYSQTDFDNRCRNRGIWSRGGPGSFEKRLQEKRFQEMYNEAFNNAWEMYLSKRILK